MIDKDKNRIDYGIDAFLRRRAAPPAPPRDLADSIIHAVLISDGEPRPQWRKFWETVQQNFVLPQPAFALALVLALGFALGVNHQIGASLPELSAAEMAQFMIIDVPEEVEEMLL